MKPNHWTAYTCGPLVFMNVKKCHLVHLMLLPPSKTNENCLGDLNLRWCVVYLDDIIVYGKSPEEMLERLGAVFEKIEKGRSQTETLQV